MYALGTDILRQPETKALTETLHAEALLVGERIADPASVAPALLNTTEAIAMVAIVVTIALFVTWLIVREEKKDGGW